MTDELIALLKKAAEQVKAMTPEQRTEMFRKQAEGVARAEASWPKSRFKWVNGVKVYESIEDYWND